MKKRSTATSLKRVIQSSTLVAAAFLMAVAAPVSVYANSLQDRIDALEQEIQAYRSEAEALHARANTLQNKVDSLNIEISAIQKKIDLSQAKYDKLQREIKETEQKIDDRTDFLGQTLAALYVESSVTPLEMLASSGSIGDFIDKQEYRSAIRDAVKTSIEEVKELKKTLVKQKDEVKKVLAQQKGEREQLAAKKQEQSYILTQTRGEEAKYRNLVKELKEKKAEAEAALAASLSSGSYKACPEGPVSAGDIVGGVGNTGLSTGPHLHLEVRNGSSHTNPSPYIKHQPVSCAPGCTTQSYGNPDPIYYGGSHPGTDYGAAQGSAISAIDGGMMYRGCSDAMLGTSNNAYGYVAIVEHASGVFSIYAHMSGGPSACNYNTWY